MPMHAPTPTLGVQVQPANKESTIQKLRMWMTEQVTMTAITVGEKG